MEFFLYFVTNEIRSKLEIFDDSTTNYPNIDHKLIETMKTLNVFNDSNGTP